MAKKSNGGLLRRAGRAWDKMTGSPASTAPSSPKPSSSALPANTPSGMVQAPLQNSSTSSSTPVTEFLVPSASALLQPPAPIPSLVVPAIRDSAPASGGAIAWSGLGTALRALHSNAILFPPLHSAIGGLLSCVESFEKSPKSRKEYEGLAFELRTLSETLDRHLRGSETFPMLDFVVKTVESIQKQVNLIEEIEGYDSTRRALEGQRVREALETCDHHIQVLSRQIQIEAGLRGANNQQQGIEFDRQNTQLEAMKPAKLAVYDSSLATNINRRACTEDTRTGVLSDLDNWLKDPNAPNVCWMNGMAGTGKTTIAYTLAKSLEKRKQLGASFFCTRTTDQCRDVNRIVPTIAYQLARCSMRFQSALCRVLGSDPDLTSRIISTQFDRLLKEPLLEVKETIPPGLVVVIDALDECTASNGVVLVLDTLLRAAPALPVRFFVTSRPEPSIRRKIQEQPESLRSIYELHNVEQSDVQADIELYLRTELPSVPQSEIKELAERAGVLFIYAATTVRYIQGGNLKSRLKKMLSISSRGNGELDKLYTVIISAALENEMLEEDEAEEIRQVLWTVICAREPMNVDTIAVLAGVGDSEATLQALEPLSSVLYISGENTVSTLHASFPDFMFDSARSSPLYCDPQSHHALLARRCFEVMREQLRFNICGLESSYIPDERVPDLEERVKRAIPPILAYTCRYWNQHMYRVPATDQLCELLQDFLSKRLLFWMEVMNLKNCIGRAVKMMLTAKLWLTANHRPMELVGWTEDARNFVTSFAANPVSQSTPHIYTSALALCHRSSSVYKCYWDQTYGLIEPNGTGIERRELTVLASWTFDSQVKSVAYSRNGTRLAVGCEGGSIIIRDAHDGTLICPPLMSGTWEVASVVFSPDGACVAAGAKNHSVGLWSGLEGTPTGKFFQGHTGVVTSVDFSPNGAYVASGSVDCTVRVWNVKDGTLVHAPFEGHAFTISSIAFSPDGTMIASGAYDTAIRVYDVQGGTSRSLTPPFKGHTDAVISVAFSPDSTHIASGSYDKTVRLWNAHDGTLVWTNLKDRTEHVSSVAFSPDGKSIVSGSVDHVVRVWNTHDGTLAGVPLRGHTDYVTSVAFSPDGTRIASGSWDHTVRVWNVQNTIPNNAPPPSHRDTFTSLALWVGNGCIISGSESGDVSIVNMDDGTTAYAPLVGHTAWVGSVIFLPNGRQIVSGSYDCTIRIWDIKNQVSVCAILEGHTEGVTSVACSPDGKRIASGSEDCTIRIWNVQAGAAIGDSLKGHSSSVRSVAFSPNGTRIVSGSADRTVRIWNIEDGSLASTLCEGHTDQVTSVNFSPDGTRVVSGSWDRTLHVWRVDDGTLTGNPFVGHTDNVTSVAFSPDGTRIISGSWDRTVRIWGANDGTSLGMLLGGHDRGVRSVAFSSDGTYIVSSSQVSICVWNLQNNTSPAGIWPMDKDGWVKDRDSQLLVWVPQDLVYFSPMPHHSWILGPNGSVMVGYDDLLLGEDWVKCYRPRWNDLE